MTHWSAQNGVVTATTTASQIRSGTTAAALSKDGSGGGTEVAMARQLAIPVTAGQPYTFSAWAKTSGGSTVAQLQVQWFNSGGGSLGVSTIASTSAGSTTYTQLTGAAVNAPTGAVTAEVQFSKVAGQTGTVYFDDIYMK